jgi:Tol biopolymer transport system component
LAIGRGSRRRFVGRELVAVAAVSLVLVGGSAGRGESLPDVEILSIDLGGRQTNLTKNPALDTSPAIAPDGRIAFVSTRDGSPDLYVMDGDGSDVRRLTSGPFTVTGKLEDEDSVTCCDWGGDTQLSWSPSGRRLAFDAANRYVPPSCFRNCVTWDAYVIRDDGSDLRLVAPGGRAPSWSPDGRSLAYLSGVDPFGVATELTIRRLDGSRVRSFAVRNSMSEVGPAWSPRGDEIAFQGRGGQTKPLMVGVARADGTRRRWLKEGRRPAWSPSGRRIAYVGRADGLDFRLLTVSSSGGPKRRLAHPAFDVWAVAWSPSGRELAFVAKWRRPGGPVEVRTITPGSRSAWGRLLTRLPAGTRLWAGPRWSPDGRRIVVAVQLP